MGLLVMVYHNMNKESFLHLLQYLCCMPQRVDDIQWVPRQLTYQEQQALQHVRAVPLPHAIEAWYLMINE